MRKVGYARVSSKEQNESRQLNELKKYVDSDMIIVDKQTGRDFNRPGYNSLKVGLGKLQKGDELFVTEIDRLGRNKEMVKQELLYWKSQGVILRIITISTTLTEFPPEQQWIQEMITNIIIEILTSEAQFELVKSKSRQSAAIPQWKFLNFSSLDGSKEIPEENQLRFKRRSGQIEKTIIKDNHQLLKCSLGRVVDYHNPISCHFFFLTHLLQFQ